MSPAAIESASLLPQADLRRILGVLWKWRWLLVAGTVIGTGAGAIDVLQQKPIYRSTAQVLVERQGPKLLKFVDQDGWVLPPDITFDTHARLMRTSPIAARVAKAKATELAAWPALAAAGAAGGEKTDGIPNALVDALLGGLETEPSSDEQGMVNVTYTSHDAALSALLANAFATEYINARVDATLGLNKNVTEWVDVRLIEQRGKLVVAEAALQKYRENESYLGPAEAARTARVAEIRAELDVVSRGLQDADRRLAQIRGHRTTVEEAGALPEIAGSKVFQELAARRNGLQLQVAETETRLGPKHPDMKKLRSELAAAETSLITEIDRVDRAARLELERLRTRRTDLSTELAGATKEAIHDSRRATDYAALEREVELNRQIYDSLLRRMKQLGLAMDADRSNIVVVEAARVPGGPIATRSMMAMLQAIAAGLLFSAGIAFLWEWADNTVKTPEELEGTFGLAVLGVVPSSARGTESDRSWVDSPVMADAFGALRSAVVLSAPEKPPQVVLVTSPGAGEGKSTIALNLAAAMSRDGVRTLLVEADLRHPVLHRRLGLHDVPGLTELLTSRRPLAPCTVETGIPNLLLLPSGSAAPNPSELLGSTRMAEVIEEARKQFGRIVIDSPPVFAAAEMLALADSSVLAAACDGVVLVVRSRQTGRQALSRARTRLATARARILGAVLNDWRRPGPRSRDLYDGYGYAYGYGPQTGNLATKGNGNGHPKPASAPQANAERS